MTIFTEDYRLINSILSTGFSGSEEIILNCLSNYKISAPIVNSVCKFIYQTESQLLDSNFRHVEIFNQIILLLQNRQIFGGHLDTILSDILASTCHYPASAIATTDLDKNIYFLNKIFNNFEYNLVKNFGRSYFKNVKLANTATFDKNLATREKLYEEILFLSKLSSLPAYFDKNIFNYFLKIGGKDSEKFLQKTENLVILKILFQLLKKCLDQPVLLEKLPDFQLILSIFPKIFNQNYLNYLEHYQLITDFFDLLLALAQKFPAKNIFKSFNLGQLFSFISNDKVLEILSYNFSQINFFKPVKTFSKKGETVEENLKTPLEILLSKNFNKFYFKQADESQKEKLLQILTNLNLFRPLGSRCRQIFYKVYFPKLIDLFTDATSEPEKTKNLVLKLKKLFNNSSLLFSALKTNDSELFLAEIFWSEELENFGQKITNFEEKSAEISEPVENLKTDEMADEPVVPQPNAPQADPFSEIFEIIYSNSGKLDSATKTKMLNLSKIGIKGSKSDILVLLQKLAKFLQNLQDQNLLENFVLSHQNEKYSIFDQIFILIKKSSNFGGIIFECGNKNETINSEILFHMLEIERQFNSIFKYFSELSSQVNQSQENSKTAEIFTKLQLQTIYHASTSKLDLLIKKKMGYNLFSEPLFQS